MVAFEPFDVPDNTTSDSIKLRVRYSSNNSGGYWWVTDNDWLELENNGWVVEWERGGRFLGALATDAYIDVEIPKNLSSWKRVAREKAITDWETITGLDSSATGCDCCGPPHEFIVYEIDPETGECKWTY